jgi:hypothetical protein
LNNLKITLLFLPIFILFFVLLGKGVAFADSSGEGAFVNVYLSNLLYRVGSLNGQRTFPPKIVTIITSTGETKQLVFGSTAKDILRESGVSVDIDDMVEPSQEDIVSDRGVIKVVKVDVELVKRSEEVPYDIKEVETEELTTGALQIEQEGVTGVREKTIKIVHQDGKVVKSEVVSTNIIQEPIEQILLIGTKPVTIQDCAHWDAVINLLVPAADDPIKNNWMRYIMRAETWCDSGQNTNNKYLGLNQFLRSTYAGNGGVNIWDGTEQIRVVSRMYDICQQKQWSPHWKGNSRIMSFKDKFPSQYREIEKSCGR